MNKIRVTYFALGALLSAVSCTTEMAEPDVYDWADGKIYFRTSLSDVAGSRAQDMTLDRLESFQVTCFNTADINKDTTGYLSPYFEDATFIRRINSPSVTTYISSPDEVQYDWPANEGLLRFFAFSPSLAVMADGNSALEDTDNSAYFNLFNSTLETESTVSIGYRLGTVRVNPDISRQFDFVTAEASGERWKDFTGGVELSFSHQFCQVELKAWGEGTGNDYEIAGVRLGNPIVEGTFIFADDSAPAEAGRWSIAEDAVKDKVEYLYRSAETSDTGDKPESADRIFKINSLEHNTPESAASIMGRGGCAMVIPTVNPKWEGLDDPNIGATPYTTGKMYFSILLRVTNPSDGKQIYPYPGNPYDMTVIYYAVDRSDGIVARLYPGQKEGEFFTDVALQHPYVAEEGEEVKDFGWAAVPVDVDWLAGKRYVYTLNYSEAIGLHDPLDPDPGRPIAMISAPVSWGVRVDTWRDAEKNDDYNPDVNVP